MRFRYTLAFLLVLCLSTSLAAQQPVRLVPILANGSLTASNAGTCTDTGTGCVILPLGAFGGVSVQVTGTWVGTLSFEASNGATGGTATWVAVNMTPPDSPTAAVTTATGNGLWNGNVVGNQFRVRMSAFTSGTAVVRTLSTLAPSALGASGAGTGTVTSVDVAVPGGFSVSGGPVTTSGTITIAANGTSGGVPYYSGAATMASSAALTANLPVIGGGAGAAPSVGTRSGNTTAYVTTTGAQTSADCVKIDANGNHIANGSPCGSGTPGGSDTQVQFNDAGSFGGDAGLLFNKTSNVLTSTGAAVFAGLNLTYRAVTGSVSAAVTDGTIELTTNAGTITLPTAVGIQGRIYSLKNLQTANALTIATTSSQTVDGAAPGTIYNGCLILQSDNANWRIVGACGLPLSGLTALALIYSPDATSVASTGTGLTYDGTSVFNIGAVGGTAGKLGIRNNTSGTLSVIAPAGAALSTNVLTLPNATDTLVGKATTDTLTNKTLTSPTLTTPVLGTPSSGTLNLLTPLIHLTAVNQNGTCSSAFSTGATAPTCTAVTGSNQIYGTIDWTATTKPIYGHVGIVEALSSTTIQLKGWFYCDNSCSGGTIAFTFSYRRVPAGGTMDQTFTGCSAISTSTPTSGQLAQFSGTCAVTSLAAGDLLMWKLDETTGASTHGTVHLMEFVVAPVAAKPIGG